MSTSRNRSYDVVVIGGGSAGIAAAVGASRAGAKTLLVERYGFLGGNATNANVLSYCGFYAFGDKPRQMVGGVGSQVLAALSALSYDVNPIRAPSGNWIIMLDAEGIKHALDKVVGQYPIDCLLHCVLIGAACTERRIEAVTLQDHAGHFDVTARAFIDASGEANLGFAARVPLVSALSPERTLQVASFPVRIGGVLPHAHVNREILAELANDLKSNSQFGHLRPNGGHFISIPQSNDLWWMGIDLITDGLDSQGLSHAERLGRDLAWNFVRLLRSRLPGFEQAYVCCTGPQIGIRESRQLQTHYYLSREDLLAGSLREDGIARGCWPAEQHFGTGLPKFQPVGGDGYYHIPLDSIRCLKIENLWAAGRVIGCDETAFSSLRVMGTAFATGHAAGVAAAHHANNGAPRDVGTIGNELVRQGAIL